MGRSLGRCRSGRFGLVLVQLPENRFERAARFVREAYESNRTDEFPQDPYVGFGCLCEEAERGKVSAMAALYARLDPFSEAGAEKLLAKLREKAMERWEARAQRWRPDRPVGTHECPEKIEAVRCSVFGGSLCAFCRPVAGDENADDGDETEMRRNNVALLKKMPWGG